MGSVAATYMTMHCATLMLRDAMGSDQLVDPVRIPCDDHPTKGAPGIFLLRTAPNRRPERSRGK